jgi:hypothetical protein
LLFEKILEKPADHAPIALRNNPAEIKLISRIPRHCAQATEIGVTPGIVIVEVPAKPQWCEIRNTVFSWARTRFPFHTSSAKKLTLKHTPVITVTGKAFFDVGHSLRDQKSNRRSHLPGYAAWEIHPVMRLEAL